MKSITQKSINDLKEKFGDQIDLKGNPGIVAEIIEMAKSRPDLYKSFEIESSMNAGYDRTYTREEEKDGYNKTYVQYDKTVDEIQNNSNTQPELEEIVKANITKFMEEGSFGK